MVPVGRVIAIYARENGQGMAFPPPLDVLADLDVSSFGVAHMPLREVGADIEADADMDSADDERVVQLVLSESAPPDGGDTPPPRPPPSAGAKRPALKRVK